MSNIASVTTYSYDFAAQTATVTLPSSTYLRDGVHQFSVRAYSTMNANLYEGLSVSDFAITTF